MLIKNKTLSTKKNKITIQYKKLPNEINLVSLRARFNLQQINLFLQKKEAEIQKDIYLKKNNNKNLSINNKYEQNSTRENKENDGNINLLNQYKSNSFFFPSHSKLKLIKEYQQNLKKQILKEKGFKSYIERIKSGQNFIKNLKKELPNNSSSLYEFFTIPKIKKIKQLPKKKRYCICISSKLQK